MTKADAKKQLVDLIEVTRKAITASGWQQIDDGSSGLCHTAAGSDGTYFRYGYRSGPDADTADALATVSALWKKHGLHLEPFQSGGTPPIHGVTGTGATVGGTQFIADPTGLALSGTSVCVPNRG